MNLKQIIKDVHENAEKHGFWNDYEEIMKHLEWAKNYYKKAPENKHFKYVCKVWENMRLNWIIVQLALIHSEVSELEEATTDENFAEELADICIRTFDLIAGLGIDIDKLNKLNPWNELLISDKSINGYISQALEHLRKDHWSAFEVTLQNIYLRCRLKAIDYGVDLEQAIKKKMQHNRTRPYKHGKRL